MYEILKDKFKIGLVTAGKIAKHFARLESIEDVIDLNLKLGKKAHQFKPKLDKMQERIIFS